MQLAVELRSLWIVVGCCGYEDPGPDGCSIAVPGNKKSLLVGSWMAGMSIFDVVFDYVHVTTAGPSGKLTQN